MTGGATVVKMDNKAVLNIDFEELPEDHKAIIKKQQKSIEKNA